jgi:[protein-PII] uridylyltransferase
MEMLRLGHKQHGRVERIAAKKKAVAEILKERDALIGTVRAPARRFVLDRRAEDIIAMNLQQLDMALDEPLSVEAAITLRAAPRW